MSCYCNGTHRFETALSTYRTLSSVENLDELSVQTPCKIQQYERKWQQKAKNLQRLSLHLEHLTAALTPSLSKTSVEHM